MVKKLNIPNAYINILREVHFMNAYLVRVNAYLILLDYSPLKQNFNSLCCDVVTMQQDAAEPMMNLDTPIFE